MTNHIYQIQIALKNVKPKVWRRIQIPSDLLLSDFHNIIQTTMGWTNSHLHQFIKNKKYYSVTTEDDFHNDLDFMVDYEKLQIAVNTLLQKKKDKIVCEYDFEDGWEYAIILEKILPIDNTIKYPICLGKRMNCPPEDCGGVWGYVDILEQLKDPTHKEYKDLLEWLGGSFAPTEFDVNEINNRLSLPNYGSFKI